MKRSQHIKKLMAMCLFISFPFFSISQVAEGAPLKNASSINVLNTQNLGFGAFASGTGGGTITVSANGVRSSTGNITLLNFGSNYFAAIFEIEAPPNSIVSILNGEETILKGSNGGSIRLKIDQSDPVSPFVNSPNPGTRTKVGVGGTLTVGDGLSSPPGNYSGEFYISIIVE